MREPPLTQTLNIAQTCRDLNQLVDDVCRGVTRVVVEKSGAPVAAIISPSDLERFNRYEEERGRDFAALRRIGEAFSEVDPAEIEREAVKAVREIRRQSKVQAQLQPPLPRLRQSLTQMC